MSGWNETVTVRLHQTDAAGVVFFANLFVMAHEVYERWLGQAMPLAEILAQGIRLPIVHAEADYRRPMRLSDVLRVELTAVEKKATSFTMEAVFVDAAGETAARVRTVHVVVDDATGRPAALPAFLEEALALL